MGLASRYIIDLQENLKMILRKPPDREMLHLFRVQVKKMKALWAIHPIGSNIPFKTSFPGIQKLYKGAAGIRDLQMMLSCLETLPEFEKLALLKKEVRHETRKKQKAFREKLSLKRTRAAVFEENRLFREYFKMASSFLVKQNRAAFRQQVIETLAGVSGNDAPQLHRVRRYCKQLIFQCEAFQGAKPTAEPAISRTVLDKLQHNLGTWHDWWNTREWLAQKQNENYGTPQMETLLRQAEKKEALLRLDALKAIKSIFHRPGKAMAGGH